MPQLQHRAEIEIQPEDRELFRELGISTPLQLALIKPKKYRDFNLYLFPLEGEPQLFEARILSVHQYKKIVKVRFHLLNLNRIVEGIYFKIPSWYWKYLKEGEQIFIWGELQERQISQPWIVSKKGEIEPVYPKTSLPPRTLRKLIKKYVTPDTLYPLPPQIALPLYRSHFPKTRQDIYPATIDYIYKWAEVCNYLYRLRKRRVYRPAPVSDRNPAPFIASLPFQLTRDQLKAINQVREDLRSPYQRRRVIIGDVGSGKTIVMLAIAYMAEKSAIMCPTSILANQIYEEAEKYLTPLGLKVVLVTQNSGATDEEINSADLLVGTHALLYRELPPLKAISIDEQHRFGTAQRRKLEELGATATLRPHHFQFSATPIPRTQALIQSNFVEVTLIKELPFKKEIETRVLPKDREGVLELLTLLKGEIEKGKQGIIVYPAVEGESTNLATLQKGRKFWEKYFSKVLVTHGKDREKEEILLKFREEGELLVTTTIIEVGISLPRLSVIAIVDADHFGLATLHQLRGRVGRYGEKGYCYLLTDNPHNPRLVQFSKILDGFQIAELDLKFRRAGDLLEGSHQSGESFRYFDEVEDREILEEVHNYLNTLEEPPAVVEPTQTSGKGDKREISPQPERGGEVTEAEKREVGEERGERKQKKQREQTKQTGQREQVGQRGEVEEVKKNGKGERVGERVGQRVGRAPENTHSHNLDSFNFYQKVEGEEKSGNFTPLSSKMGDNGGKGGENLQPLSSGESHSQSPSHLHSSTSISSSLTPKAPILGPKSPILEKEEEKLSPPDGEEGKKSNSSTHSILDSSKKSSTGGTKEEKISTQEPDSPTPPIFTSESESFDQNTFTYLPSRWEATFPFDFPQSDLQILPEKEKKKEEVTSNLPHQFHQNFPILAEEETKENLTSVNPKPADSSSPTSPTFQKEGEKIPKGEDLVSTTSKGEKSFSSQISTTPGKREGESPSNFGFKKGEGEVKLKRGEIQKEKKESTPFESDRKGAHLEKGKESFTSKRAPISPKPSEKERKKRRRREKTPHLSSPLHSIGREKNSTLSKNNTPSHPPTSEKGRLFPKDSSRLEKREKNSSLDTSSPKRSSSTLFPELEPLLDKFSSREKEFTERDSFSSPSQNPSSQSKPSTSNLFNSSPDLPHSSPPDQTSQNSHNPQNSGNSSSTPSKSTSSRYQTPSLFEGKK